MPGVCWGNVIVVNQLLLTDATKPQLEAFSTGFSKLIPAKYLRPFTAHELQVCKIIDYYV